MHRRIGGVALAQRVHLRRVRGAAGLSTGGATAGFRMCRLRAAAIGDRRDGLSPHPHGVAQMVRGGMAVGQDKRGVSALFLARELALRYDTAWLMAHKLRHGLSERPEYPLDGLIEIDESYYGGRGKPASRGRGLTDPNKSLMAIAVETVPASPRQGKGIKQSHFVAGSARIAVLPAATAADLGGFVRGAAKPGARIITDGLKSYDGLADSFRHYSIVQDGGKNADAVLPIVHVLFSNVKTWLNGTFHGVSAKHLPRYAREWNYRFNRRRRIADLTDFLLRRAATRPTITYRQLVDGAQINGALPASTG